ncbi:MAG: hypothetical protein HQK55_09735, partial [Deltaproteobacteria bacterium]|nr:hypothetical protein [Deltaproteobacteria bacterium]
PILPVISRQNSSEAEGFATRLVKKSPQHQNEPTEDYLNIILKESEKLENLIKEFLEFSRLRSGKFSLNLSKTNIKSEILEIIDAFMPQVLQDGIKIQLNFDDDIPSLNVDSAKIRRVLNNLIGNAVKYSDAKSTISISAMLTDINILI